MWLNLTQTDAGLTVVVKVGDRLDISRTQLFAKARDWASQTGASRIDIDLGGTRRLFDSGLAILMRLRQRMDADDQALRVTNCEPSVDRQLRNAGFSPASDAI